MMAGGAAAKIDIVEWVLGIVWTGGWGWVFFRYADAIVRRSGERLGAYRGVVPGRKVWRIFGVVAMLLALFSLVELVLVLRMG
jgi:hypothetical protein